jgi:receptor-type tyrosine-protein phosphatase N
LAAVLAGYGVELRQLTPEQLSTLSTLLQLLPKGTGKNLGECPGRKTNFQLHRGLYISKPHGVT